MDEGSAPTEPAWQVVASSDRYLLTQETDGFALWDLLDDGDEPAETFLLEAEARAAFEGLVEEERRFRRLPGVLTIVAVASGIAYVVLTVTVSFLQRFTSVVQDSIRSTGGVTWFGLLSFLQQSANAIFIVSVGWFLITWLDRRWRARVWWVERG
jgi:hypothetical protein